MSKAYKKIRNAITKLITMTMAVAALTANKGSNVAIDRAGDTCKQHST